MERELVLGLQPPPERRGARLLRSPHSEEHEFQRTTANLPIRSHRWCQKSSPAFAGRNSEEAATPGQASTRHRVSGNPPAVHPREPPETPDIFPMLQQALKTSSRLRGSNVPDCECWLKNKIDRTCDKTVDDVDILWKVQEKPGRNRRQRPPQRHKGTENAPQILLDCCNV